MRGVLNKAAVHLALVAMLLRALLPAGWMPSGAAENHASPIMLCPGMDHMAMPHMAMPDAAKHDRQPAPDHAKSTYCACAAVGHVSLASPLCAADVSAPAWRDAAYATASVRFVGVSPYRPNAARAPPSLA
ncbi:MAG: hypothetical protein JOZ72_11915 [Alphaproteobacteria bacterium]|nr:hypothetical protein [Alphaproteobacteria bacterium]